MRGIPTALLLSALTACSPFNGPKNTEALDLCAVVTNSLNGTKERMGNLVLCETGLEVEFDSRLNESIIEKASQKIIEIWKEGEKKLGAKFTPEKTDVWVVKPAIIEGAFNISLRFSNDSDDTWRRVLDLFYSKGEKNFGDTDDAVSHLVTSQIGNRERVEGLIGPFVVYRLEVEALSQIVKDFVGGTIGWPMAETIARKLAHERDKIPLTEDTLVCTLSYSVDLDCKKAGEPAPELSLRYDAARELCDTSFDTQFRETLIAWRQRALKIVKSCEDSFEQ